MKNNKSSQAALMGMMCALSIAISFAESLIPQFIPIAGAKPGFSNIVTMFGATTLGAPYALGITLFKAFFALITRGTTAFFMSLCGGLFSLAVLLLLLKTKPNRIGYIGIGVLCAVFHNAGQFIVAVIILGEAVIPLAPLLTIMGVFFGIITGAVFGITSPRLQKTITAFAKNAERGRSEKC